MATISEILKGTIPCPHRVLHALDDANELCAPHMGVNSPSTMRLLKKATSLTLVIVRYVEDHPVTQLPSDEGMGIGISCMINGLIPIEVKLGFIAVKELKPDVAMEEWSEEEWAWFIVIFLYMISEHLPKAATCSYTLKFHYKLHPVNALAFGEKLVEKMAEIAESFSMDPKCCWAGFQSSWLIKGERPASSLGPSSSGPSRPSQPSFDVNGVVLDAMEKMAPGRGVGFLPCPGDLVSDVAVVFDTSWHWRRAGELLGTALPDYSLKPGLTYLVGINDLWVRASDGSGWYPSARDYIKYRLGSVASSLPAADQRKICDMIVKIASADQHMANTECDIFSYALRVSREVRGSVPQALREAFKRYNIVIPEMVEAGVLGQCESCGALESQSGSKLLVCSGCREVRYCNRECQKAHWKEHKPFCQANRP